MMSIAMNHYCCLSGIPRLKRNASSSSRAGGGRASILAFFDMEALLEAVGENGNIEMTLATWLMSGQAVYGTDEVRIFAPRRRPH